MSQANWVLIACVGFWCLSVTAVILHFYIKGRRAHTHWCHRCGRLVHSADPEPICCNYYMNRIHRRPEVAP